MKRILVSVLAVLLVMLSLCSCTQRSGRYKVLDLPEKLTINAKELSEDLDNKLNMDEAYPLLGGVPEEDMYFYVVNPLTSYGVVVKYNGFLQYFSWNFIAEIAKPEIYMTDYNGDGQKDIAITYVEDNSGSKYSEALHILLCTKSGMEDCYYSSEKAASDTQTHLMVARDDGANNKFTAYLDGIAKPFTLDGYSSNLLGVYAKDVVDYTLGDNITVEVNPGLVFEKTQQPVYNLFTYTADIAVDGSNVVQKNPKIEF